MELYTLFSFYLKDIYHGFIFYMCWELSIHILSTIHYLQYPENGYLVVKFERSRSLFASALGSWWRIRCSHTGSLCSFHATSSIGGSTDNVAGAHHWFLALLEAYWMLPNSKIDEAWKGTGNQCVSSGYVTNSQEHLRKDFCYAWI